MRTQETATTIFFDLDGTIADLYGVDNWLDYLINRDPFPYAAAKPLIRLNVLARTLNLLQKKGYRIGVISWLSKNSTESYDVEVTETKKAWLKKHLKSVHFDEINIVPYGTPKYQYARTSEDILFDDELNNRESWNGKAYSEKEIFATLKKIA